MPFPESSRQRKRRDEAREEVSRGRKKARMEIAIERIDAARTDGSAYSFALIKATE